MTMVNNELPWYHGPTAQEHYLAVGKSYSQGFTIGFFLCFSLALVAVSAGAWAQDRRREKLGGAASILRTVKPIVLRAVKPTPILARRQAE